MFYFQDNQMSKGYMNLTPYEVLFGLSHSHKETEGRKRGDLILIRMPSCLTSIFLREIFTIQSNILKWWEFFFLNSMWDILIQD